MRTARLPASLQAGIVGTPILLDRHGDRIAELPGEGARLQFPVGLDSVAPWLITATIGLEDQRFWEHSGIDGVAIGSALIANFRHGEIVSGASTITQQLVKNAAPPRRRSFLAKLGESLAALRLEREWSKDAILSRYLNHISYGNRFRGVEAAARQYFGKAAANLSPPEAIFLAGLPRAPSRYNPWSRPAAAAARYRDSLDRLAAAGLVTDEQLAEWVTQTPTVLPRKPAVWKAPHFVSHLRQQAGGLGGPIQTTLDLDLQSRLESTVAVHLRRLARHGAHDAAAVILDHGSGAVRAWVGSGGWGGRHGEIDGVTLTRSSGSILKPFVYLSAIDRHLLTAATLLPDTPDAIRAEYPDYDPKNYDQRYWGPVRVREALANSLNVPAVVALSRLGAGNALAFLDSAGIRTPRGLDAYGAGLILGNAEVRLLDVTAAFGVFARGGTLTLPSFTPADTPTHRVIASPEAAAIVADILSDNDARRKSFGPFTPLAFESRRIPCKTGTSSGFRDAWTIGATGTHCVGVWVGNFSGAPMRELASVTGPAPLWRDIVIGILGGDPDVPAPEESGSLTSLPICAVTGAVPTAASPHPVSEWFLEGTGPVGSADDFYHGDRLVLPPDYALWCGSSHNYLGATVDGEGELQILMPRDGSRFLIDPHLARDRQKIDLLAVGGQGEALSWSVNGTPLSASAWPLVPGEHRLEVSDGESVARAIFSVEE